MSSLAHNQRSSHRDYSAFGDEVVVEERRERRDLWQEWGALSPRRSGCVLLKYKTCPSVLKATALHRVSMLKDSVFHSNIDRGDQVRHLLRAKTHTPN